MTDVRELLYAAESGNVNRIKECIRAGGINVVDEEGSSPLMYSAANGAEKVVSLLIQGGVDVNQQNHYGWTALLQASCYGHHEVVYTLLQNKANINLCNNWGTTPLVAAAQGGFTTVVQVLLEKGATVMSADEVSSITPLMAAAQCGNECIIKLLLDHGSNPNTRLTTIGWTALMFASLNNHVAVVKELISRGAVTEMRDVNNQRAFDLASLSGLSGVVSILSEDVTGAPSSDVDIFEAVKSENVEMLTEIIKKHKVSVTVTDKDGATPLMYAARKGNIKACQLLLEQGADFDAQDQIHRWTSFMHAVHHGHYKVAKLLAQYGANVNLRAKNGSSAFDIANLIGDTRTIRLIAEITIQRLSEKKEKPPSLSVNEDEREMLLRSPTLSVSPQPGSEQDNDEAVILRRLSNAYLASGSPSIPNQRDIARAGSHSPFAIRSPSPDPRDTVLPAVTKPISYSPFKTQQSPSSPSTDLISNPPSLKVPHRRPSGKTKSVQSSFKPKQTTPNIQKYKPVTVPLVKKPNLHLPLSPFVNEDNGYNRKNIPQIKSPRSLPTESFSFLKKGSPTTPTPKGSQFNRSSNYRRLPPNFSSSSEKPRMNGSSGWNAPSRPHELKLGSDKGRQFNSPSAKIASFDKIKLPTHKGLDLKTVLTNGSLGQYYTLFEDEEMDINTFLTLNEQDLIELGLTDEIDRKRAISVILKLKEQPPLRSPLSPKPYSASSFKFQ